MTELDPKPWTTEPNIEDVRIFRSAQRSRLFFIFAPRKGYEQDESKYL